MNRAEAIALATRWAKVGVPAFPVALSWSDEKQSVNKVPLTKNGFKDATADVELIPQLFKVAAPRGAELGVGLVPGPGGYIVLDVDVKGNARGVEEISAMADKHGWPGRAMRVDTASGGLHYWFKRPYEEHIGNSAISPGVDIRADAGYVVAPGTTSSFGNWERDKTSYALSEVTELAPSWAALLDQRTPAGDRAPIGDRLTVGQRHAALTRLAGAMRRQGAEEPEILAALRAMNAERCDPPKGDEELVQLAKSVVGLYDPEPEEPPSPIRLKGRLLGQVGAPPSEHYDDNHAGLEPLDLQALLQGERPEEDWLVRPIIPLGKLVGFVSKRGVGKSLLLFDIATKLATGQAILQQEASEPRHVVYLDMEMGADDVYSRLEDFGWHQGHSLLETLNAHLHYYQLVGIPPLDTKEGGEALEGLVIRHNASLVVVDTVSRVISGAENEAEPFRDMFRHTESRLKRRGVTLARLDHLGKDATLGSRGSSAKEDPLDVIWQMEDSGIGHLNLKLDKGRVTWLPRFVQIRREGEGGTTSAHTMAAAVAPDWLVELVAEVDELGVRWNAGRAEIRTALAEAGKPGQNNNRLADVAKYRKARGTNF